MLATEVRGVERHSAELRKELGLADLVLTQILYVVGLSWVGAAAKLGDSQVAFWLAAMALFYLPQAAVVVHLSRRFPLEGGLAITPYVHPRLSLDVLTGSRASGGDRRHLTLDFDVGGSLEVTRQLAVRASVLVSGAEVGSNAAFGLGLTFTPPPLRR